RRVTRIEEEQEGVAHDPFAVYVHVINGFAVERHAEAGTGSVPRLIGHFTAFRRKPENILDFLTPDGASLKEPPSAEDRVVFPQGRDRPGEGMKGPFRFAGLP